MEWFEEWEWVYGQLWHRTKTYTCTVLAVQGRIVVLFKVGTKMDWICCNKNFYCNIDMYSLLDIYSMHISKIEMMKIYLTCKGTLKVMQ